MSSRKANLYALMLIALTACTKQNITPATESVRAETVNSSQQWWPFPNKNGGNGNSGQQTAFGLTQEQYDGETPQQVIDETQDRMNEAGVNLTRVQISLSEGSVNKSIDAYLEDGNNVQILVNWQNAKNGERNFPTSKETNFLKSQAEAFFQYYAPYKNQIAFVAVENEWDWQVMHGSNLQDYLNELAIITNIGHQYGFKVTDGGITATSLKRWTYSQLTGEEQEEWLDTYWIGLESGYKYYDYNALMNIINTYIAGVKNINIDYSNVHWHNDSECGGGFGIAAQAFLNACNTNEIVCNEFSISTNSLYLFSSTVDEIRGNAKYAVAYSGNDKDELAIRLTDAMLDEF
jgi:hypothetical protein